MREIRGQILRPGEEFEAFMDPPLAALDGYGDKATVMNITQNRAHYLLSDTLNGKKVENTALQELLRKLGWKAKYNTIQELLVYVYSRLKQEQNNTERTSHTVVVEDWKETGDEFDPLFVSIIQKLKRVEQYLVGAYLHGSFGDDTYVRNYSDVDILFIVKWSGLKDKDAFEEIRTCIADLMIDIYTIDPHQHHGIQVAFEYDLEAYSSSYLPVAALLRAKRLVGAKRVEFFLREDILERRNAFWRSLQRMRKSAINKEFPPSLTKKPLNADKEGDLYSFKFFTSFVMLLPSTYFLLKGDPCHKAESFRKLPEQFSCPILKNCTKIRSLYPEHVSFIRDEEYISALREDDEGARSRFQPTAIPSAFWDILGDDYFEDALNFAEHLWKESI